MRSGPQSFLRHGRAGVRTLIGVGIPVLVIGLGTVALSGKPVVAQAPAMARTVWDGVFTQAQAERGKATYEQQCAFCHRSDLSGEGFAPALVEDSFLHRWQDGSLGDLFTIVKVTMPQDKPESLTPAQYADIVAFILQANKYPAGPQELAPDPAGLKAVMFKKPGAAAKP